MCNGVYDVQGDVRMYRGGLWGCTSDRYVDPYVVPQHSGGEGNLTLSRQDYLEALFQGFAQGFTPLLVPGYAMCHHLPEIVEC